MVFDDKISSVVCGCKTPDQLDCALTYAKLALKAKLIGPHKYHFIYGTITTLKSLLIKKKAELL